MNLIQTMLPTALLSVLLSAPPTQAQPTAGAQYSGQTASKEMSWYFANSPFPITPVLIPSFPAHDFLLSDYGGTGDGKALNTMAFQKAIQACAAAGGGRVLVPAGNWLTGPIQLQSHVDLHLQKGAVVQFTRDHSLYPFIEGHGKRIASPIYGYDLEDIALTGDGIFDGAGDSWRPVKKGKMTSAQWQGLTDQPGSVLDIKGDVWWPSAEARDNDSQRPYLLALFNCRRILIQDVTLRNSPKFVFCPNRCSDLTMDNAHIFNEWWAQNGDGIDISGCKRVMIYRCTVNAGDDGICMKSSGAAADGPGLQDVIIAGCTVYRAHGGFVIGSNTDGGMHNVFVSDCTFIGSDVGLRFKSSRGRGGLVDNIFIRDITMRNIVHEAILFDTYYEDHPAGSEGRPSKPVAEDKTPEFKDFHITHIDCHGAETAISITGLPQMPIHDIYLDSVAIQADKGFIATQASNIDIDHLTLDVKDRPVYRTDKTVQLKMHLR